MDASQTLYEILDVPESATHQEVRDAFRILSQIYHPDKITSTDTRVRGKGAEKFREIKEAYDVLGNEEKRRQYDEQLKGLREQSRQRSATSPSYQSPPSSQPPPSPPPRPPPVYSPPAPPEEMAHLQSLTSPRGDPNPFWSAPRFALLAAVAILAVFPKILSGTHSFFYRDYGVLGYPFVFYFRESFWRGELPLWNPLSNCGAPFLAQWGTMVCYPFSLVYLLLPLPWSLGIFCLAHLFLAALGMYHLTRHWTKDSFVSTAAALLFAFNGATLACLIWPNYLVALGWMPWVVLTVTRGAREGGTWLRLGALAGAMQMLSGVPEIVLLTWLLLAVLALYDLIAHTVPRSQLVLRLALIISLIAGLSAIQLLPFFDLLLHSQRTTGFYTSKWAMPSWGWANLFVPLFHYFHTPQGTVFQAGQEFMSSYYLGIGTVALACLGLVNSHLRSVWVLGGLALFSLIMALGDSGVLYTLLKPIIPLLGVARYPIKFVLLSAFILPVLAAFGLLTFSRASLRQVGVLYSIFVAVIGLILWFAWKSPLPYDRFHVTLQSALTRLVFLTVILFIVWWQHKLRAAPSPMLDQSPASGSAPTTAKTGIALPVPAPAWSQAILLFVFLLDLLTHTKNQNPTIPAGAFSPKQVMEILKLDPQPAAGGPRVMISPRAELAFLNSAEPDFLKDFLGKRRGLWSNLNLLDDCPKVNGSSTLQLGAQKEVQAILYAQPDSDLPALADFLAVSHMTAPHSAVQWVPRTNAMPFVTGGARPIFADSPTTLRALASPEFDPRQVVYFPPEAQSFISVSNSSSPTVELASFSAHQVQVRIRASEPAIVVIPQSHYHLWKATLDGKPLQLWRVNHAFQGVQVPAGLSHVIITYRDRNFFLGAVISGLSALLIFLAYARERKREGLHD